MADKLIGLILKGFFLLKKTMFYLVLFLLFFGRSLVFAQYTGGINDGYSSNSGSGLILYETYLGGIDDGYSSGSGSGLIPGIPLPDETYLGGSYDGWASTGFSASLLTECYLGGSGDGHDLDTSSDIDLDVEVGEEAVSISSQDNQTFIVNSSSMAVSPITITDIGGGNIVLGSDIRVHIPSGLNMAWDTDYSTAAFGGAASEKCSASVTFEDANKTLKIDVITNFAANDDLVISSLYFKGFNAASPAGYLGLDVSNSDTYLYIDDKYIEIISDSLYTGGLGDGHDCLESAEYTFGADQLRPLRFEGLKMEGLKVE